MKPASQPVSQPASQPVSQPVSQPLLVWCVLSGICLLAGCATGGAPGQTVAQRSGTAAPAQVAAEVAAETPAAPQTGAAPDTQATAADSTAAASNPAPAPAAVANPVSTSANTPAKPAATAKPSIPRTTARGAAPAVASAAPPASPAATPTPAPVRKPDAAAPLDLKSLEQQLRETRAIGLMTKLTLKNQVDDLVDQFKAYYEGRIKMTLADLRPPFDRLIMKVVTLLQDADAALARSLVASREALWGILADPVKFKSNVGA